MGVIAYEVQGMFNINVPSNGFIYWGLLGLGTSEAMIGVDM